MLHGVSETREYEKLNDVVAELPTIFMNFFMCFSFAFSVPPLVVLTFNFC